MKKTILSLSATALLGMASCSEDFEVAAPYKDVTIVYGIWDKGDTAHYVRIQKAFLDENKSAVQMAKEPDSSFYRDGELTVILKELNNVTGALMSTTTLSRVDMRNENYYKDSAKNEQGFFTMPNYAYKTTKLLNPANRYRLMITNNTSGKIDSADLSVVSDIKTSFFENAVNNEFNFAYSSGKVSIPLSITPNAAFYESALRFNYYEVNALTKDSAEKHIQMYLGKIEAGNVTSRIEIQNANIYEFLAREIGKPADNQTYRLIDNIDLLLYAGNYDLYQYQELSQSQGGITSDQIKPNFTNIRGKDVIGLFASKHDTAYLNYKVGISTIDSLIKNPKTSVLGIQRQ